MDEKAQGVGCCCASAVVSLDEGGGSVEDNLHRFWVKIALSMILAGQSMVFGLAINMTPPTFGTPVYYLLHGGLLLSALVVTFLLGKPLFVETWKSIGRFRITVEGMFVLSAVGALVSSLMATVQGVGSVYYEVVAIVMIIYSIGKTLGMQSKKKVEVEIQEARNQFNRAFILNEEGEKIEVFISDLKIGDVVVVDPGEAIAVDGEIVSGEAFVKETVVNGELEAAYKGVGEKVFAGSYSVDGSLEIRNLKLDGARELDGILKTIEEAKMRPSKMQEKADQVMQYFLPVVVMVALGTFLFWYQRVEWAQALLNSMSVLLVACPCALGLATPIAVWGGLWKLTSMGLVVRTGRLMDALARVDRIVFDKTGTLSEDELKLVDFRVLKESILGVNELKQMVMFIQKRMNHPVAKAFRGLVQESDSSYELVGSKVISGKGVCAKVKTSQGLEYEFKLGSMGLMEGNDSLFKEEEPELGFAKKLIYISCNDVPCAVGVLEEEVRQSTVEAVEQLSQRGMLVSILTGDPDPKVKTIGGVTVESGLSAEEKTQKVRGYIAKGEAVVYIGDGVNDAGAMALCEGSIAMGRGAALTCSSASAVFNGSDLSILPRAVDLIRKVDRSIKGNMIFALCYNCVGIGFAMMGELHPVVAALIMVVSSGVVSVRALRSVKL